MVLDLDCIIVLFYRYFLFYVRIFDMSRFYNNHQFYQLGFLWQLFQNQNNPSKVTYRLPLSLFLFSPLFQGHAVSILLVLTRIIDLELLLLLVITGYVLEKFLKVTYIFNTVANSFGSLPGVCCSWLVSISKSLTFQLLTKSIYCNSFHRRIISSKTCLKLQSAIFSWSFIIVSNAMSAFCSVFSVVIVAQPFLQM